MIFSRIASIVNSSIHRRNTFSAGNSVSPWIVSFRWSNGFGSKYSDPSSPVLWPPQNIIYTKNEDAVAATLNGSPYICAYQWSNETGFGAKYADPTTLAGGNGNGISFHPESTAIIYGAGTVAPKIYAHAWSSSGFGTKYADPVPSMGTGGGIGSQFNDFTSDGKCFAFTITNGSNNQLRVHPWSTSGFGTKYADAPSRSGNNGVGCRFSPNDSVLAITTDLTPFIHAWNWSSSGFGTKFASPATLPTGGGYGKKLTWSNSGNTIAMPHDNAPYASVYPWNNGFGTKYADPATSVVSNTRSAVFSSDDRYLIIANSAPNGVMAYEWSNGFGSKIADSSFTFSSTGRATTFSYSK